MTGIPKRKRSGGPRTQEGRLSASANSLKSGTYASLVVLPNESEQEFLELQHQFLIDFMPEDVAEVSMVHELAAIVWKKLRLEKLEKSAFLRALNEPLDSLSFLSEDYVPRDLDGYLANIEIFTEAFIQNFETYAAFIAKVGVNPGKEEFFVLCEEVPSLFQEIVELVKGHYRFKSSAPNITPELVISLEYQAETGKVSFINYALKEIKSRADDVMWIAARLDKIKKMITNRKEQRLLSLMQSQGPMRARDELSRSFYRTLSELRKQQEWRLKMRVENASEVNS